MTGVPRGHFHRGAARARPITPDDELNGVVKCGNDVNKNNVMTVGIWGNDGAAGFDSPAADSFMAADRNSNGLD